MKIILLVFLKRIFFLGFAASTSLAALFFGHSALAQPLNDMALNIPFEQTYRNIDPQPKTDKQRIEVLDFFWYRCPFCYQFLPTFLDWSAHQSKDVVVRHIPAIMQKSWIPDAHLYYTLETLGEVNRLHQVVFDSVNLDHLVTNDPQAVTAWAVAHGIEEKKWMSVFDSDVVRGKVSQAILLMGQYDIHGTPSLVVDGRYQTNAALANGVDQLPAVLNHLVSKVRATLPLP